MEEIPVTVRRAVVRSHNVTLEGESLREYIDKLDRSIAALRCLAAQASRPASTANRSACTPVTAVRWWGTVTHETIVSAVKERFGGDSQVYMECWLREMGRLTEQSAKDALAMVNDLGLAPISTATSPTWRAFY